MKIFLRIILCALLSSCAVALPPSGPGIFYTEATELVYYDPYIKPNQKATICSKNILGLVSRGDNGFMQLKLNSEIRKISTIERTYKSRFLMFAQSCIIVKGEI